MYSESRAFSYTMDYLTLNDKFASVTCSSHVLVTHIDNRNMYALTPTSVSDVLINGVEQETKLHASQDVILCVDLSRCCHWIALCSSKKELSIWCTNRQTLLSKRFLLRSAEKVKFTPSSKDVIVADKSGDAYIFSVEDPFAEGKLLLGHLSMLLDVLISDDEKFIITCDRDEKIRVSHFPNAYNIQAYCLGHKEFVSCIKFIPHDKNILISGSGDGYLRFWNYVSGTQIQAINCDELVNDTMKTKGENILDDNVNHALDNSEVGSSNNYCVVHVSCFSFTNKSSLIGVCIQEFKGIIMLRVSGSVHCFDYCVSEMVSLEDEPWDICFSSEGVLWNLSGNKDKFLRSIYFDKEGKLASAEENNEPSAFSIFTEYRKWQAHIHVPERKTNLYKRKFDNILDYAEKKKARLAKK